MKREEDWILQFEKMKKENPDITPGEVNDAYMEATAVRGNLPVFKMPKFRVNRPVLPRDAGRELLYPQNEKAIDLTENLEDWDYYDVVEEFASEVDTGSNWGYVPTTTFMNKNGKILDTLTNLRKADLRTQPKARKPGYPRDWDGTPNKSDDFNPNTI